jgi:hypothetical protein
MGARLSVCLLYCLSVASFGAFAQDAADKFFDTRTAQYFGNARAPLVEFLRSELPLKQPRHRFCIVGYESADGAKRAWVHWREGNKILLWEGSTEPKSAKSAIKLSRSRINLRKDVVKSDNDVAGSTFLVTEAWVNKIETDCRENGVKYSVNRPRRKG